MSSVIALRVTGLKADASVEELRAAFSPHGYVKDVQLVEDEPGVAVVRYETRTALAAVTESIAEFSKNEENALSSSGGVVGVKLVEEQRAPDAPAAAGQSAPHMEPPPQQQQPPSAQQEPSRQPGYAPPQQQGFGYGYYGNGPPAHGMMASGMPYDQAMYWGQPWGNYGGMPMGGMGPMGGTGGAMPPQQQGGGGQTRGSEQVLTGNEVKLFVGGLPLETTDNHLRMMFGPYGTLVDVHIMKPSNHSNQRCAFVSFEHHVSALAATKLGGVHRVNPQDRPIVVRFADTQAKRQRSEY